MNAARRKNIREAMKLIEQARAIIEIARIEEQEVFDNLSADAQFSKRGYQIGDNIDNLEDALVCIDEIKKDLEKAVEQKKGAKNAEGKF